MKKLPELTIGNLKITVPIIQGGMGIKISLAKLASAVANAGGVGTISAAIKSDHVKDRKNIEKDDALDLREFVSYVREAKALTKGIIAVNIMVALSSYPALVQAAVNEKVDIIFSGAGLPLNLPKLTEGSDVKIAPIVSSARVAEIICKTWTSKYNRVPDAVVVEGPRAGGHLGYSLEEIKEDEVSPKLDVIVSDVIETVKKYEAQYGKKIPVIAAGGIFDGKDIARMINLGASGVQMATRFVCTDECDADMAFKQAYINAKKEDLVIIKSPVGMPGRAINNKFLERAKNGDIKFKCSYLCLRTCNPGKSPYCIAEALSNAAKGNLEEGFAFAGSNVYRVDKITSVKTLMDELVKEAKEALGSYRETSALKA